MSSIALFIGILLGSGFAQAQKSTPVRVVQEKSVLDSPEFRRLSKRLAQRRQQIQFAKKNNWLGETPQGLLQINPQAKLPTRMDKKVKALLSLENRDREALLQMLVKTSAEGTQQEKVIRQSFFESQLARDPAGVSYLGEQQSWMIKKREP